MPQDHAGRDHRAKGFSEHGVCFGSAIAGLLVVAVVLQWLLGLVP